MVEGTTGAEEAVILQEEKEEGDKMTGKEWFQKAVEEHPPNNLAGWKKKQPPKVRRRHALTSRPRGWTTEHKYRSLISALNALANVTQDKPTEKAARNDAKYFSKKLEERS